MKFCKLGFEGGVGVNWGKGGKGNRNFFREGNGLDKRFGR